MRLIRLIAVLLLASSTLADAAPPTYLTVDHSTDTLMDATTARAMWTPRMSAKMLRLYPYKKWGFVSEVEGGFDNGRVCVVTARAMMLPRSGKTLVFRPAKTATAYGTRADATEKMCRDFAKLKLNEAMDSVTASLLRE